MYYIYAYLRQDGTPYYIGKGSGSRVHHPNHTINRPKDKNFIIFMETNLTEIGALALERRYIRWYGRKDNGTGILRNLTDGGEGCSGYKQSDDHIEKRKKFGNENGMYGKTGTSSPTFNTKWMKLPDTRKCMKVRNEDSQYWLEMGWVFGKYQVNAEYVRLETS